MEKIAQHKNIGITNLFKLLVILLIKLKNLTTQIIGKNILLEDQI